MKRNHIVNSVRNSNHAVKKMYADEISVATNIRCEHMEICNRIEKYLKSTMEEKDE